MKISACLITLNEEKNLPTCLRSCENLADEIVIVDSGSTDGTEKAALQFGAKFVRKEWAGYVEQKNHVLSLAENEWILSLDADEELSPRLRDEIAALKKSDPSMEIGGFDMPRCVQYEGRWIRHGDWYPDRLVRLFRRGKARFAGGRVHERLEISGTIKSLRGDLYHHSFVSTEDHWRRCERYARLWAQDKHEAGWKSGRFAPELHGMFRWTRAYLLRAGFLDGRPGWRIACISAREASLKYKTLRSLNQQPPATGSAA